MAIAYKSQGAGVSTQTSGAALSPACPAVVDAGDILIGHVFWEGTATAPSTPSGWELLYGPAVVQSTIGRHWVFGKVAAGTEDGTTVAFGNPAVTTQRAARIYSFSGRISGTILELVNGFSETSHATDPQMPTVITTEADNLAVALIAQNDNNTAGNATGETGGNWTEAVAEYVAALTPGLMLQIQTCVPTANPGTVTGGTVATTNDPVGVIGFQIRQQLAAITMPADGTSFVVTGTDASLEHSYTIIAETAAVAVAGQDASLEAGREIAAEVGAIAVTGTDASLEYARTISAEAASFALTGTDATLRRGYGLLAESGSVSITGQDTSLEAGREITAEAGALAIAGNDAALERGYSIVAESGSIVLTGTDSSLEAGRVVQAELGATLLSGSDASLVYGREVTAEAGAIVITGSDASALASREVNAELGAFTLTGADATLDQNPWDNRPIRTGFSAQAWS